MSQTGGSYQPCGVAAGVDEKVVGGFVIGVLGQFRFGEGVVEFAMEREAPGVDFGPGKFPAANGEQRLAVGVDAEFDVVVAQRGDAGEKQADEVHGVFPFDLALVAEVLFELFELRENVGVVGAVDVAA